MDLKPVAPTLLLVLPGACAPPTAADDMAATVRRAFLHAWSGYERHAWGHDELLPLTAGARDWHPVSLPMTPLDAYDTMLLMGLEQEAARAKGLILERLSFDHDFSVQVFEVRTATRFGALDAFLPAVLALGGDTARAARLMESVYSMWTAFGIGPEQLDYVTMEPVAPAYVLRPEAIESAYYLFRLTGDDRYREMGRTMIDSVLHYTRTESGFAALSSVVAKEKTDRMESFFLAETLKYAYLLFAPGETLDFDAVIFNTEAHPIQRTWR